MRFNRATAFVIFIVLLSTGRLAAGQETDAPPSADTAADSAGTADAAAPADADPSPQPCPPKQGLGTVKVTSVKLEPPPPSAEEEAVRAKKPKPLRSWFELRDTIAVTVENLHVLVDHERCLQAGGPERDIILYLDRRPLPDVVAYPPGDPEESVLRFPLRRTEDSRDVWTYLLGRPKWDSRKVAVSVGIDNQFAVSSDAAMNLRVIPRGWFYFWLALLGAFVVGFLILASKSELVRDPVAAPGRSRPPYSLARAQAAWWFFIILGSYLFIGMITGDFSTSITQTVLILLGISAGTAAGSAFVDASKTNEETVAKEAVHRHKLHSEMADLDRDILALRTALQANPDELETARRLKEKEALRASKYSQHCKLTNQSESFLLDILSDTNGVNFHRFQMAAWTVVLGIIFIGHVYRDLAMPEFDAALLGLMGISAATYLSLKIPENKPPEPPPPDASAVPPTSPQPAP